MSEDACDRGPAPSGHACDCNQPGPSFVNLSPFTIPAGAPIYLDHRGFGYAILPDGRRAELGPPGSQHWPPDWSMHQGSFT